MPSVFTPYQKFVIAILAFLQFMLILDFMIIGPLGALLLQQLHITTRQFGLLVSVYALSAGTAGLMAAGFADKFDRKRLLILFYAGFLLGTLLCGIATSYRFLLVARIVTGLFGGVMGSVVMAIVADLFPLEMRGRAVGTIQMAFGASQVLGLPLGLFLSTHWGWHAPFIMIVAVGAPVVLLIASRLQPVVEHLKVPSRRNPLRHLVATIRQGRYLRTFLATTMLAMGGFMLMPFGSTFLVNNVGIPFAQIQWIYMITGAVTIVAGPLLGKLADTIGKYRLFVLGSLAGAALVIVYCNLGRTSLATILIINVVLFVAVTSRMVSAQALISAVPDMPDRGAFMSLTSALQQYAGAFASALAGMIVFQTAPDRPLLHYDVLGYVVTGAMMLVIALMHPINRMVMRKAAELAANASATAAAAAANPAPVAVAAK